MSNGTCTYISKLWWSSFLVQEQAVSNVDSNQATGVVPTSLCLIFRFIIALTLLFLFFSQLLSIFSLAGKIFFEHEVCVKNVDSSCRTKRDFKSKSSETLSK